MPEYNTKMGDLKRVEKRELNVDTKHQFLSAWITSSDNLDILLTKIRSESICLRNPSYDNMCRSGKFEIPLHSQCNYSYSKLITPEDIIYLKTQDKKLFWSFFEEKILHNILHKAENQEIFVQLLWQTFEFFKDKLPTNQQMSTVLEFMFLTHNFYLTHYLNTAKATYEFLYQLLLQYTITDPPECDEIFTLGEAKMILEFFREVYLENIVLLYLIYKTHYCIVIQFDD